jgi:CHAT domain-containing protein
VLRIERISISHAEMAYLSACSTAELSLGKHIDEAINLVNCFQVLGYRHVIGTIWSASDESAGRMASAFYTNISKESYREYSRLKAAQALHDAILEYAAECEGEDGPLHWVPYVHVGT